MLTCLLALFPFDRKNNEASIIRVIDMSNDGTLNTGYALNYDDAPNFDSGNRRHTSFASVFVSPEVDDDIDI